jgi:hypothetical protein
VLVKGASEKRCERFVFRRRGGANENRDQQARHHGGGSQFDVFMFNSCSSMTGQRWRQIPFALAAVSACLKAFNAVGPSEAKGHGVRLLSAVSEVA